MKCDLVFYVLSLFWVSTISELYDTCTTPLGSESQCISIHDCSALLAAFEQRPLQSDTIRFLKKSQCGFQGYDPLVCCGPLPRANNDWKTSTTRRPPQPTWGSTSSVETSSPSSQSDGASQEDSSPAPQGQCGTDDNPDKIYGGQITDIDEFPWMALLGYRTRNNAITYQCGGVLINKRYVLTAAHCVTGQIERDVGSLTTVRLGEYDTQEDIDCIDGTCADRPQEIPVARGYPHRGFSDSNKNRKDDIALVRLAKRARYTAYVKPICLIDSNGQVNTGDSVYVAGWGKTLDGKNSPVKLKLRLPVFNKNDCFAKYQPLGAALTEYQVCAGGSFAQDACRGDSGGPLMRRTARGDWEAIGVVSFGNGCGKDGWPGVYTSVASYGDWIRETMRTTNN